MDNADPHGMETPSTATPAVVPPPLKHDGKAPVEFVFDTNAAKGRVLFSRTDYGVEVSVDGKPLLLIDLYYKAGNERVGSACATPVHVQFEDPRDTDTAGLHAYVAHNHIELLEPDGTLLKIV